MKFLKFIIDILIIAIMIIVAIYLGTLFISIFDFVLSFIIIKLIFGFLWFLFMCGIGLTFVFCGYFVIIEFLETHFKFFTKYKNKEDK